MPGGTAVAALGSIAALQQLAEPPEVVGVAAWHHKPSLNPFALEIDALGVDIVRMPLPRLALYSAWHLLRHPRVERISGPVDVIHATGMAIPPASAPLVITVNDLAFLRYPNNFTSRGRRFFSKSLQLTARDADIVVCPSRHTWRDCEQAGIDPNRLRLVPYGTDARVVHQVEAAQVRQRFGLDERFVLWVGTVEPRKNLSGLLQAWRMLGRSNEQLVLVGPQGWKFNLKDELKVGDGSVRCLGFVSDADKRALMSAATVFCYPSFTEGFGLPVLEAMVQATPVVTSSLGATAELASDVGLLIQPSDPRSIADAVARLLDDSSQAEHLGQKGQQLALKEYRWQSCAEKLMKVYRELVS